MKKINNKGFMLAEVLIVSAIIMVTLVGIFKGFSNTNEAYKLRNSYYDTSTLYALKNIESFLIDSMALNNATSKDIYEIKETDTSSSDLFKNIDNKYLKASLQYFFDTYGINKLYLAKYYDGFISKITDSDVQKFTKFYIKENDIKTADYNNYTYILITKTNNEKYAALRIK